MDSIILDYYSMLAFWGGGIGQVAAAIGTAWVVWQTRKMLDRNDRADRLSVFMDFSREYDVLKDHLSHESQDEVKLAELVKNGKLSHADVQACIDLMKLFERQHFLHVSHMVDATLWRIWKNGIAKHFAKGLFRYVWQHRKKYPAAAHLSERFTRWIDETYMTSNI